MTLDKGPYYKASSQVGLKVQEPQLHDESACNYPDPSHSTANGAHIYSLADDALSFSRTSIDSHFAGLVQAATAAAGEDTASKQPTVSAAHGIKQTPARPMPDKQSSVLPRTRKRKREDNHQDLEDLVSNRTALSRGFNRKMSDNSQPEARESISLSANALFRRPSTSSKKYTRPPMSKMFTSLELSPEDFLRLQAAAKGYMLDRSHPERIDCVGQRGKGDSEMVKLRLWSCVKDFLECEGNGEVFFGRDAPSDEGLARTMFWPIHKNNIISAVTPLLRRMVTNERQRQYAIETRKSEATSTNRDCQKRKASIDPPSLAITEDIQALHGIRSSSLGERLENVFKDLNGGSPDAYPYWTDCIGYSSLPRFQILRDGLTLPNISFIGLVAILDYHVRRSLRSAFMVSDERDEDQDEETINRLLDSGCLEDGNEYSRVDNEDKPKSGSTRSMIETLLGMVREEISGSKTKLGEDKAFFSGPARNSPIRGITSEDVSESLISHRDNVLASPVAHHLLVLHINIIRSGQRVSPRFETLAQECLDLKKLLQKAACYYEKLNQNLSSVHILQPKGLTRVHSNAEWTQALKLISRTDWMDGETKVLIQVKYI